ncbi:tyrosine-type recombinase/integrase [Natrialbaceae archaeon A-CW3]
MTETNAQNNGQNQSEWIRSISDEVVDRLREEPGIGKEPLDPITPSDAVKKFIETKEDSDELAEATIRSYRSRLEYFVEWCNINGIGDMNDVKGRDLHQYRIWRQKDLNTKSQNTQQKTLRQFIKFCGSIEAVPIDLWQKVAVPSVDEDDEVRDEMVTGERAKEILGYLSKYHYASREHVVWLLLIEVGIRRGALYALDHDDYHPAAETPHLDFNHRPQMGTPLKNGKKSERKVSISQEVCGVLNDYIADRRCEVTDDYERSPLITSSTGRLAKSTIQKYVYKWTRPCVTCRECPHGKVLDECVAAQNGDEASKCPSSLSPHPIRRGYITHSLSEGVPVEVLSQRCDVARGNLEKHYDARTEVERMQQRNQILAEILNEKAKFGGSSPSDNRGSD